MLMSKKLATVILIVSFVGILVQMYYNLFMSKSLEVYGPGGLAMPVMVLVFGLFLIWFSRKASSHGWIS